MRSTRELLEVVVCRPKNLLLAQDEELLQLLSHCSRSSFTELLPEVVGECICRDWLYQRLPSALEEQLAAVIGQEALQTAREHFRKIRKLVDLKGVFGWETSHRRIATFLRADGIIPVVLEGIAYPLPFEIVRPEAVGTPCVVDAYGHAVPQWSDYISQMNVLDLHRETVRLPIENSNDPTETLRGHSLELPVIIARLRADTFQALGVVATGAIEYGRVATVTGIEAKKRLAERLNASFIAPDSGIPIGTAIDKIPGYVVALGAQNGFRRASWREAVRMLESLRRDVHSGQQSPNAALASLEVLEHSLQSQSRESELLTLKLLQAACLCHLGKAALAKDALRQCCAEAERLGLDSVAAEAQAQLIAGLNDLGVTNEAVALGKQALAWLESRSFGGDGRLRAELALWGSLGQAQLLLGLRSEREQDRQDARASLEQAAVLAEHHLDEGERCRNLNYIHLWHACFAPGETSELNAAADAIVAIDQLPSRDREINHSYLWRQQWYAAYRYWLQHASLSPNPPHAPPLPEADWQRALALKYRAALRAARFEFDAARQDFAEAAAGLTEEKAPVMQFLRGTTLLQAGESLRDFSDGTTFLEGALRCFLDVTGNFPDTMNIQAWINRCESFLGARGKDCDVPNPQLWSIY